MANLKAQMEMMTDWLVEGVREALIGLYNGGIGEPTKVRDLITGDRVCYLELSPNPSPDVIATVLYNIQGQVVIRYDDGYITIIRESELFLIEPAEPDQ